MFLLLALVIHVAPAQKSASDVSHSIVLRLSEVTTRDVAVTLDLISPERTWSVAVKTKGKTEVTLVHPPCACMLRARAEEYAEVTRPLGDDNSILLRRLPVIRGVVVDGTTGAPLARAEVAVPGSKVLVVTDARGAFRIVVDGAWPSSLRVEHPLRAPSLVAVPRAIADTELPPVRLGVGGTIQLNVAPPIGGAETLGWEIRKDDAPSALVRSGELAPGTASARIEKLEAGTYRVLVKGSDPLQRTMGKARVTDQITTQADVVITPLVVDGKVTFDGAPLAGASLEVSPRGLAWRAKVSTDADGSFSEELWQPGEYKISVTREPLVHLWGTDRTLEGDGRIELALDVPNRRVRGHVADARGDAVADAVVFGQMKFGENTSIRNRTRTAADGTFEFTGVEAGEVTLSAQKTGYRSNRAVTFFLAAEEIVHEVTLVLDELAFKRHVVVTDGRGLPIPDAGMFAPADSSGGFVQVATTDEQGRATIALASPDQRGMVYVIPRSGSLGFTALDGEGEIAIRVLDSAALELRVESTAGEPIPRVLVLMSINGVRIPSDIVAHMARIQGVPFYSDASGRLAYPRMPPGHYELWPIASKADDARGPAPVRVAVLPGPQTIVMKFKPK